MKIKIIRQITAINRKHGITMGRVFPVVEDKDGLCYRPGNQLDDGTSERAWIMGDVGEEVIVMGFEFEILDKL